MPVNLQEQSILASIKKLLGIATDDDSFDEDITMHINSTFSKLHQMGVGSNENQAFQIEGEETKWGEFTGNDTGLNMVKTYIYRSVKLAFDYHATSFALEALKELIKEDEWRLTSYSEGVRNPWTPAPIVQTQSSLTTAFPE